MDQPTQTPTQGSNQQETPNRKVLIILLVAFLVLLALFLSVFLLLGRDGTSQSNNGQASTTFSTGASTTSQGSSESAGTTSTTASKPATKIESVNLRTLGVGDNAPIFISTLTFTVSDTDQFVKADDSKTVNHPNEKLVVTSASGDLLELKPFDKDGGPDFYSKPLNIKGQVTNPYGDGPSTKTLIYRIATGGNTYYYTNSYDFDSNTSECLGDTGGCWDQGVVFFKNAILGLEATCTVKDSLSTTWCDNIMQELKMEGTQP